MQNYTFFSYQFFQPPHQFIHPLHRLSLNMLEPSRQTAFQVIRVNQELWDFSMSIIH